MLLATRFCICTIVVKDRTKDNYDLVRTFNQFCGVEKCDAIIQGSSENDSSQVVMVTECK